MSRVETEQDDLYLNDYKPKAFKRPQTPLKNRKQHQKHQHQQQQQQQQSDNNNTMKDEISTAVSWPILLAIIPTLGAFVVGSAEVWSDFIMILLILFYVYKWITVPWTYYESARSRRLIHQHVSNNNDPNMKNGNNKKTNGRYKETVEEELRKHEMVGLTWVIISPAIAGYTLQYSRYFLSNYDKYMSSFNVTVFILAASIRPIIHIMALLRERTVYLQREAQVDETELEMLQKKVDLLEEEMDTLRTAFATKRDLGQVTSDIGPSIQHLSKSIKQFKEDEKNLKIWSEAQFKTLGKKVYDFEQIIRCRIEQDQRKSAQRLLAAVMFLPVNIAIWAAGRLTMLLPIPRGLLSYSTPTISATSPAPSSYPRSNKHLTHPDLQASFHETNMDPSDTGGYLGEEFISRNDMGHRLQT